MTGEAYLYAKEGSDRKNGEQDNIPLHNGSSSLAGASGMADQVRHDEGRAYLYWRWLTRPSGLGSADLRDGMTGDGHTCIGDSSLHALNDEGEESRFEWRHDMNICISQFKALPLSPVFIVKSLI
jgi:hypothetical protein